MYVNKDKDMQSAKAVVTKSKSECELLTVTHNNNNNNDNNNDNAYSMRLFTHQSSALKRAGAISSPSFPILSIKNTFFPIYFIQIF